VTGEARLKNGSAFGASIEGYSILSSSGALRPGDAFWHSLTDQGSSGWVEAGPAANALSELNPLSQMLVASGVAFNLGTLFNPAGTEDVTFEFQIAGNSGTTTGIVMYGPLLAGDFNRDGIVDVGDYVLWRKMSGQLVARGTGADGNGDGNIDNVDYQLWQSNFGQTLPGAAAGAGVNAVPEPNSGSLLILIGCCLLIVHPRSWRIGNQHLRAFCRISVCPVHPARHSRELGNSLVESRQRGFALYA
jgi:hypothetical protein